VATSNRDARIYEWLPAIEMPGYKWLPVLEMPGYKWLLVLEMPVLVYSKSDYQQ
jgi:hypothetical protein